MTETITYRCRFCDYATADTSDREREEMLEHLRQMHGQEVIQRCTTVVA